MLTALSLWFAYMIGIAAATLLQAKNSVNSANNVQTIRHWFGVQYPQLIFRWLLNLSVFGWAVHAPQIAQRLANYQIGWAWPAALFFGLFSDPFCSMIVYGYASKIPGLEWLKNDLGKVAPPPTTSKENQP